MAVWFSEKGELSTVLVLATLELRRGLDADQIEHAGDGGRGFLGKVQLPGKGGGGGSAAAALGSTLPIGNDERGPFGPQRLLQGVVEFFQVGAVEVDLGRAVRARVDSLL